MEKLAQCFSQPNTYKGIAMLASVFGIGIPVTVQQAICQAIVGLISAWAVIRDEYKVLRDAKKKLLQKKA